MEEQKRAEFQNQCHVQPANGCGLARFPDRFMAV